MTSEKGFSKAVNLVTLRNYKKSGEDFRDIQILFQK
jgi:hypothetical protein